MFIDLLHI